MGGFNTYKCLQGECELWKGQDCDEVLSKEGTVNIEEGTNRQRIVCGYMLGPLSSELSADEVAQLVLEDRVPYTVDRIVTKDKG